MVHKIIKEPFLFLYEINLLIFLSTDEFFLNIYIEGFEPTTLELLVYLYLTRLARCRLRTTSSTQLTAQQYTRSIIQFARTSL